jgi:multidrug transporter EmrE-like cation transporter
MSFSVQLGLLFALATAVTSIVGFLLKYKGADESPPVTLSRPVSSSLALFRSRWYTIGIIVATASWGLHVAALALAPISLVQSVIAGGLVLLTVIADRVFGFTVTKREWICVALVALGLAFLAATMEGTAGSKHSDYDPSTLALYVGAAAAIGLLAAVLSRRTLAGGPALAVSAGLLWGASDVSIKALSDHLDQGAFGWIHPLALVILVASLVGLAVSARSLQVGEAVSVIAVTSACANLCTIAAGPVVFGEPLPNDPFELGVRLLAFALVIGASALTPPPLRSTEPGPGAPAAGTSHGGAAAGGEPATATSSAVSG